MADRPVDALWGVGPKTAKKLAALDITTVGQLAHTDAELLTSTFGPRTGLWLLLLAKGGGDTDSQRGAVGAALAQPRRHLPARPHRPSRNGLGGNGIGPAHAGRGGGVERGSSPGSRSPCAPPRSTPAPRSASSTEPSIDPDVIVAAALRILDLFELDRPVRLLGVRLELEMPE